MAGMPGRKPTVDAGVVGDTLDSWQVLTEAEKAARAKAEREACGEYELQRDPVES